MPTSCCSIARRASCTPTRSCWGRSRTVSCTWGGGEVRTKQRNVAFSGSCSRRRSVCWVSSSTTRKPKKHPAHTPTTIRTATSGSRQALPSGLRLAPPKRSARIRPWLGVPALALVGIGLGFVLSGAPLQLVVGTIAALLAIGAAIYRPALGLAILAFTYPYDLDTYAGPVKLTTSYALLGILVLVWVGREILPRAPGWRHTQLDWPVALFGAATALSILGLTGNYRDQLIAMAKEAGGFALFFLVTQSLRERADVWIIMTAIVATGLIQAITTVVPVITGTV